MAGNRGRGGGSDPSSGPRRLVKTPVAVHLLPSEKVVIIAGRERAHAGGTISLSAGERGDRKAEGAPRFAGRGGEGLLPILVTRRRNCIDNRPHELVRMFQHHGVGNPQQSNAEGPQTVFFGGIIAHLVDLRVNPAIELNGEPMFEAVKIQDAVFDAELPAEFRAQSTITQQGPSGLFRLRGARSQLANARGGIRIGRL